MNYFEFYKIPITFKVDEAALKRIFYLNSKKYHPDFFTLESEEKQSQILELSTLNNEAYQTLKDFDKRMKYVLELKGLLSAEGKDKLPQSFLMEMMEINEALMELEFDFDAQNYTNAKQSVEALAQQLDTQIAPIIEHYDDANANVEQLNILKNYFLKKRYLLRIFENLSRFAPAE